MRGKALPTADKADRDRWLTIELRHLAALATVAQQASFSGAADTLGYVQSAVSQQVRSLERIVGCTLVDRDGPRRPVTLTDAGNTLLEHADDILEQLRLAKADVDSLTREPERTVSFGIANIFGTWVAAAVIGALLRDGGGSDWRAAEPGSPDRLLDAVEASELDAAFVPFPIASGPFFGLELGRQPYVLAVPAAARTRNVGAILEEWPLVDVDGCRATRELLERRDAAWSLHQAPGPTSALALVRSGAAVAVVTARDVPGREDTVATIPLPELPDRIVGVAWHRDRDECRAVVSLREAARSAFREFDGGA